MCGRFILSLDFDTIQDLLAGRFHLVPQSLSTRPRYNIAPTQQVLTLIPPPKNKPDRLGFMKWGLVPTWSHDESIGSKMINTRSETADEKPSFKDSFDSKNGSKKGTCTILTTTPNKLMASIHDRMPVIFDAHGEQKWLEPDTSVGQLKTLLIPYGSEDMYAYPVPNYVNATSHQGTECLHKVTVFENTRLDFH